MASLGKDGVWTLLTYIPRDAPVVAEDARNSVKWWCLHGCVCVTTHVTLYVCLGARLRAGKIIKRWKISLYYTDLIVNSVHKEDIDIKFVRDESVCITCSSSDWESLLPFTYACCACFFVVMTLRNYLKRYACVFPLHKSFNYVVNSSYILMNNYSVHLWNCTLYNNFIVLSIYLLIFEQYTYWVKENFGASEMWHSYVSNTEMFGCHS